MNKTKISDRIFDCINIFIMLIGVVITIYPIWYIMVASLSEGSQVTEGNVVLWIRDFTTDAYKTVFNTRNIWVSYGNTIFYAVFGTALSMFLTILGAYALSKRRLKGRKIITFLIVLSMWFGAGMMPTYINFKELHLLDSRLGILLCGAVSTFNFILLRTFFESIPASMEEVSKIDGASDFQILIKVYLPLSIPALMTIILYYFVGRWNSYFWQMIMINSESKLSLQVVLKKLVVEMSALNSEKGSMDYTVISRETVMYAMMVIAALPMIAVYPFIQKYFVKGIMVGAIKG